MIINEKIEEFEEFSYLRDKITWVGAISKEINYRIVKVKMKYILKQKLLFSSSINK